ncbi:hypothetical protein SDC9_173942 [bioreactor metagenome]|uniref:Uncharacterized protein n=1 Tax=bioreactor metagenome TaxID=1076179 RepID=A0A645GHU6_9ZZZZ
MRISETPSPTGSQSPKFPCSADRMRWTMRARARLSFKPTSQASKSSVRRKVFMAEVYPYGYVRASGKRWRRPRAHPWTSKRPKPSSPGSAATTPVVARTVCMGAGTPSPCSPRPHGAGMGRHEKGSFQISLRSRQPCSVAQVPLRALAVSAPETRSMSCVAGDMWVRTGNCALLRHQSSMPDRCSTDLLYPVRMSRA